MIKIITFSISLLLSNIYTLFTFSNKHILSPQILFFRKIINSTGLKLLDEKNYTKSEKKLNR